MYVTCIPHVHVCTWSISMNIPMLFINIHDLQLNKCICTWCTHVHIQNACTMECTCPHSIHMQCTCMQVWWWHISGASVQRFRCLGVTWKNRLQVLSHCKRGETHSLLVYCISVGGGCGFLQVGCVSAPQNWMDLVRNGTHPSLAWTPQVNKQSAALCHY